MCYKEIKVTKDTDKYIIGIECAENSTAEEAIEEALRLNKFKSIEDKDYVVYVVDISKEEYIELKRKEK